MLIRIAKSEDSKIIPYIDGNAGEVFTFYCIFSFYLNNLERDVLGRCV
jgi:hypothetical protein